MLTFLAIAPKKHLTLDSFRDEAVGSLRSFVGKSSVVLLYASPTGLLASLLNRSRFTLVEGIAGEDGCYELVERVLYLFHPPR
jgi:hypothetical protein